jgi:hypothetical protein
MPDDIAETEAKLRKLAELLHRGWERRCPATEQEMEAVRKEVRKYLKKKRKARKALLEDYAKYFEVAKSPESGPKLGFAFPVELPEAQKTQLPVEPLLMPLKQKKAVRKHQRKKAGTKRTH